MKVLLQSLTILLALTFPSWAAPNYYIYEEGDALCPITEEITFSASPKGKDYFYFCENGIAIELQCPPTRIFNVKKKICEDSMEYSLEDEDYSSEFEDQSRLDESDDNSKIINILQALSSSSKVDYLHDSPNKDAGVNQNSNPDSEYLRDILGTKFNMEDNSILIAALEDEINSYRSSHQLKMNDNTIHQGSNQNSMLQPESSYFGNSFYPYEGKKDDLFHYSIKDDSIEVNNDRNLEVDQAAPNSNGWYDSGDDDGDEDSFDQFDHGTNARDDIIAGEMDIFHDGIDSDSEDSDEITYNGNGFIKEDGLASNLGDIARQNKEEKTVKHQIDFGDKVNDNNLYDNNIPVDNKLNDDDWSDKNVLIVDNKRKGNEWDGINDLFDKTPSNGFENLNKIVPSIDNALENAVNIIIQEELIVAVVPDVGAAPVNSDEDQRLYLLQIDGEGDLKFGEESMWNSEIPENGDSIQRQGGRQVNTVSWIQTITAVLSFSASDIRQGFCVFLGC